MSWSLLVGMKFSGKVEVLTVDRNMGKQAQFHGMQFGIMGVIFYFPFSFRWDYDGRRQCWKSEESTNVK